MSCLKKLLLSIFVFVFLAVAGFFVWIQDKYIVPILMYHHVSSSDVPGMNVVNPGSFRRQMSYLKNHGYQVISFDALVSAIKNQKPVEHKMVVITFDDGYVNNYTNAYPILKEFNYPAIFFMISDLVGKPGYMTWEQLGEISRNGLSIGSHTRWHAYLPDASEETQIDEIEGSKRILEQGLGGKIHYFSYPSGGFTENVKKLVARAGYKAACTTNRGHGRHNSDIYELKRIRINDDDDGLSFWAKLSGYYNLFRKVKNSY